MITERDPSPAERAHYGYTQRWYALIYMALGLLFIATGILSLTHHRTHGDGQTAFGIAYIFFGIAELGMAVVSYRRSSGAPPRGYRGI